MLSLASDTRLQLEFLLPSSIKPKTSRISKLNSSTTKGEKDKVSLLLNGWGRAGCNVGYASAILGYLIIENKVNDDGKNQVTDEEI